MKIIVQKPVVKISLTTGDLKKEISKCAVKASLSRGKLRKFYIDNYGLVGFHSAHRVEYYEQAERFIKKLLSFKPFPHDSVLEHGSFGVDVQCSRVATHQIVRHRNTAFTQESTRYVRQGKNGTITLIKPMNVPDSDLGEYDVTKDVVPNWVWEAVKQIENVEMKEQFEGWTHEDARYMLPHCIASWIGITANLRQWRHMIAIRTHRKASPELQYILGKVRDFLIESAPVLLTGVDHG